MEFQGIFLRTTIYGFLVLMFCAWIARRNKMWRRRFFIPLVILFPFTSITVLEYFTIITRWDQFVFGDYETIADAIVHKDEQLFKERIMSKDPKYFDRGRMEVDGFEMYWPIQVRGFHINDFGLRTKMPMPKGNDLWRVAVVGGSTTWARHVFDEETIPGYLESNYRAAGKNVEVYNMGLEGMQFSSSLRLIQKFQPLYNFDQVVFYHGVNEFSLQGEYQKVNGIATGRQQKILSYAMQFRLFRFLKAIISEIWRPTINEDDPLFKSWSKNREQWYLEIYQLTRGYCKKQRIRCDFFLQPTLFHKPNRTELETVFYRNYRRIHPYLEFGYRAMVKKTVAKYPRDHYDLSGVLEKMKDNAFMDWSHGTAATHKIVAKQIYDKLTAYRKN